MGPGIKPHGRGQARGAASQARSQARRFFVFLKLQFPPGHRSAGVAARAGDGGWDGNLRCGVGFYRAGGAFAFHAAVSALSERALHYLNTF